MASMGFWRGQPRCFFSFIGFDSVTTLAEEVSNPRVDIPFGVIATLGVATTLYVSASLVVAGMVPWNALDPDTPLARYKVLNDFVIFYTFYVDTPRQSGVGGRQKTSNGGASLLSADVFLVLPPVCSVRLLLSASTGRRP